MADKKRIFATSRIGDPAENRLREQGYELEVFQGPEAPPKKLIIEKVKSGIDALITTLRDPIDAEVFEAGKGDAEGRRANRGRLRQHQSRRREQIQNPIHEHRRCAHGSDRRVCIFHDGHAGAQDVAERATGARTEVAFVASVPAVPRRRSDGQDDRDHRHRTHRPGDDQEMFRVRHEHSLLRSGVSERQIHRRRSRS